MLLSGERPAQPGEELKTVAIIQARTSSSRLAAKVLLPVATIPSAVLAALRGGNRNHPVIFATSDDASDDALARRAAENGLSVFRGPLDDVLARFYHASASLDEDCVVVRLT